MVSFCVIISKQGRVDVSSSQKVWINNIFIGQLSPNNAHTMAAQRNILKFMLVK